MAKRKDKPEGMAEVSAMREAQRRWGKYATARFRRCVAREPRNGKPRACTAMHAKDCPGGFPYCDVGYIHGLAGIVAFNSIKGSGATFDEAFAEADLSDHEKYKDCCVSAGGECAVRLALKVKVEAMRALNPGIAAGRARAAATAPTEGA
jgi:hypothetical protein